MEENRIVLLKNDQALLPLDFCRPQMVGLTGPYADRLFALEADKREATVRKGLKRFLRDSFIQLEYHLSNGKEEQAMEALGHCDVVILVLGEVSELQGREDQLALLKEVHSTRRPVITVLTGDDWHLEDVQAYSCAVVSCKAPGALFAQTLAAFLYGKSSV